jgi:hypothetical protein
MELTAGHIHIFDLYRFVAEHPNLVSKKNGNMREYTKLVTSLVDSIPKDKPGWYLWGRFNDVGFWKSIYLGKAGNKKTSSLRARIKEELLDERAAFWATLFGSELTERQFQRMTKNKYGPGTRSYRKRNVHFIVWASASPVSEEEIRVEECVLIDRFRPSANIQRMEYPQPTLYTEKIMRMFDKEIRNILNARFQSKARASVLAGSG